jgi:hypothetical protein
MSDDRIFGFEWDDILRLQRKQGKLPREKIDLSKPAGPKPPTDEDRQLLAKYGSLEALVSAGLHGVVDRLRHTDNQTGK